MKKRTGYLAVACLLILGLGIGGAHLWQSALEREAELVDKSFGRHRKKKPRSRSAWKKPIKTVKEEHEIPEKEYEITESERVYVWPQVPNRFGGYEEVDAKKGLWVDLDGQDYNLWKWMVVEEWCRDTTAKSLREQYTRYLQYVRKKRTGEEITEEEERDFEILPTLDRLRWSGHPESFRIVLDMCKELEWDEDECMGQFLCHTVGFWC